MPKLTKKTQRGKRGKAVGESTSTADASSADASSSASPISQLPAFDENGELQFTAQEDRDALVSALVSEFRDGDTQDELQTKIDRVIESSFSALSSDLKAEDDDWVSLRNQTSDAQRAHAIRLSRRYVANDANCRQAVRLYVDFAISRGLVWRAKDDSDNRVLTAYWENPRNRRRLSLQGQRGSARTSLVDGECYLAHSIDAPSSVRTRLADTLKVSDWLVDEDDPDDVLGYLYTPSTSDSSIRFLYFDWLNTERRFDGGVLLSTGKPPVRDFEVRSNVVFQSIVHDSDETGRGVTLLHAALIWARFHRHFMRIRAAIQQAIAMFARKVKAKGTQKAINNLISSYQVSPADAHKQQIPPASSWFENENVTMTNLKQDTGADSARVDSGMLLQMFGAAVGIFPHYFGAGEAFRLATAGAMEPPMLKAFDSFQQVWRDEYRYLFEWVLALSDGSSEIVIESTGKRRVDVTFPIIRVTDVPKMLQSLNQLFLAVPALVESEDYQKRLLTELDFQDIPEVWERVRETLRAYKAEQVQIEKDKIQAEKDKAQIENDKAQAEKTQSDARQSLDKALEQGTQPLDSV